MSKETPTPTTLDHFRIDASNIELGEDITAAINSVIAEAAIRFVQYSCEHSWASWPGALDPKVSPLKINLHILDVGESLIDDAVVSFDLGDALSEAIDGADRWNKDALVRVATALRAVCDRIDSAVGQ